MGLGTQFLHSEVKTTWEKPNSCSCGFCCEPQLFISELPLKPEYNIGELSRLHLKSYSININLLPPIIIVSRERELRRELNESTLTKGVLQEMMG